MTAAKRDRRYRAPDRETILAAAAELFDRRGYRSTTMQDLADHLGIAKATLYAHTKSKIDVLTGILDQWTSQLQQDLDAAVNQAEPAEMVRTLLRRWTERAVQMRPQRAVFLLCAGDHELPPELSRRYRDWEREIHQRLRDLVELSQQMAVVRPELVPQVVAVHLSAIPNRLADHLVDNPAMSLDVAVEQSLDMLLNGLFVLRNRAK